MENVIFINLNKFSFYSSEVIYIIYTTFRLCFQFLREKLNKEEFNYKQKIDEYNKIEETINKQLDKFIKSNNVK